MIENLSERGFRMPAEWEKQESVWITWPYKKKDWPGLFRNIPEELQKLLQTYQKSKKLI